MSFSFAGNRAIDPSRQIARTGIKGRGRVKQVFQYPQLAHVWAQQEQEQGRSPKGQMYFHGDTIFSYGAHFPIARFTETTLDGQRVVLFNSGKYSPTTSTHMGCVRNALRGLPVRVFHVPAVSSGYEPDLHRRNVENLLLDFNSGAARLAKAHVNNWQTDRDAEYNDLDAAGIEAARLESLNVIAANVVDYCQAFNLELPELDVQAKADKIRAAFARYYSEKQIAKRKVSEAAEGLRHWRVGSQVAAFFEGVTDAKPNLYFVGDDAKRAIAAQFGLSNWQIESRIDAIIHQRAELTRKPSAKRITREQWQNGARGELEQSYVSPTLVRRVGDTLETSRGADCPFNHAVVAFLKAQKCRMSGTTWKRNGEQIRVGHFNVDSIDASGNMIAGCHTLEWGEMLRLAIREIPHLVKASFGLPAVLHAYHYKLKGSNAMTRDISNRDDIIDSRDVIARLEELESNRKPWCAGWNMPGYMPDSEPALFETFEEARDYIADEIERAAEHIEGDSDAQPYLDAAERWRAIDDEMGQGETVGGYHYWIAQVDGREAFEDESDFDEYTALKAFADECENACSNWTHGETLIRDSYFEQYAQEFADDIGAVNSDASWPNTCIDWKQAARELQSDYSCAEFDGVTYWFR